LTAQPATAVSNYGFPVFSHASGPQQSASTQNSKPPNLPWREAKSTTPLTAAAAPASNASASTYGFPVFSRPASAATQPAVVAPPASSPYPNYADESREAINARATADQAARDAANAQSVAYWAQQNAQFSRAAINARVTAEAAASQAANAKNDAAWTVTNAPYTRAAVNARATADDTARDATNAQSAAYWAKQNAPYTHAAINARVTAEAAASQAAQIKNDAAWAATNAPYTRAAVNARATADDTARDATNAQSAAYWAKQNAPYTHAAINARVTAEAAASQAAQIKNDAAWAAESTPTTTTHSSTRAMASKLAVAKVATAPSTGSKPSSSGLSLAQCATNIKCATEAGEVAPSEFMSAANGLVNGTVDGLTGSAKGVVALGQAFQNTETYAIAHPEQAEQSVAQVVEHPIQSTTSTYEDTIRAVSSQVASAKQTAANFVNSTDAGYGGRVVGSTVGSAIVLDGIGTAARPVEGAAPAATSQSQMLAPGSLRFSQVSAGSGGKYDAIASSMRSTGWNGPPIDAVQTSAGVTTIDNTRVVAAQAAGLKSIPVTVHDASEPLPSDMAGRFGTATTWGEALNYRTASQSPPLPPTGTATPPRIP
jgi:hypothetical protein